LFFPTCVRGILNFILSTACSIILSLVALFVIYPFQGGKIRSKLGAELSGADGVVIEEGTAGEGGKEAAQRGMRK